MALNDDDVREILRIIDDSKMDELRIETEGLSLHVRRGGAPGEDPIEPVRTATPAAPAPGPAPPAVVAPAPVPAPAASNGAAEITAPMLGTFYRAEAPGKPPFVEVGTQVQAGDVVCVIEVMKMMNSIEAGVSGTVVEVCATNADLVEYGQPLFRVAA